MIAKVLNCSSPASVGPFWTFVKEIDAKASAKANKQQAEEEETEFNRKLQVAVDAAKALETQKSAQDLAAQLGHLKAHLKY